VFVQCFFVLVVYNEYFINISEICNYLLFFRIRYMCLCSMCCIYMFQLILMMLGHTWLTYQFVYSTAGQIGSSFAPLLFAICVLLLSGYSCESLSCFLVYHYVYNLSFWYISIHVFYIKWTYSHISIKYDIQTIY
jgi:hypothetical protein